MAVNATPRPLWAGESPRPVGIDLATILPLNGSRSGAAADVAAVPGRAQGEPGRFELVELPGGAATVVDLVAELVAAPRRAWSRVDAALVLEVLAERPGYAALIPWARRR